MRFLAAILAFLCLATPALSAPKFPALTGRVVDGANILSPATRQSLDSKLAALEAKNARQLVVVTLPSLQGYEISDFGYQLGRAWGIGQAKLNNGALLIVAPTERKVRIEVGYGLEPVLTDAFSSIIIQTQILPKFRNRDYDGGVTAGVDALIAQLSLETSAAEAKAAQAAAQLQNRGGGEDAGIIPFIILIIVVIFIVRGLFGGGGGGGSGFGGRRNRDSLLPLLILSSLGGGRGGGWSGGGGGSWGGGGGGSFGGGGSSGSW
jgi:uncharacterized protein